MPFSSNTFDNVLVNHVNRLNPERILDIGAGAGKNGRLIRERCSCKPKELHAIEPTRSYIDVHNLEATYDKVFCDDAISWIRNSSDNKYDLVIITDVLEHLFKSEAIDVIDSMLYRTSWLIAVWPTNLPQDSSVSIGEDYRINNPYEIHKCNLKISELAASFELQNYIRQFGWYNWNDSTRAMVDFHYAVFSGILKRNNESLYSFKIWE
jgi:hypothetical protein